MSITTVKLVGGPLDGLDFTVLLDRNYDILYIPQDTVNVLNDSDDDKIESLNSICYMYNAVPDAESTYKFSGYSPKSPD